MPIDRSGYNIDDQYGTYFMTFTFVGWIDVLTRVELKNMVIEALLYCQTNKGLILNSYVLMPSHIHLICRANDESDGLSRFVQDFKKHTAREIVHWVKSDNRESRADWLKQVFMYHAKPKSNKSTYQVWQRSNQPKLCQHPKFIMQKLNYIHNNPVKDGWVDRPEDYIYSSARDYVGIKGMLDVEIIDFGVQEGYIMSDG
jgi:Transposase and inactivated derivatives